LTGMPSVIAHHRNNELYHISLLFFILAIALRIFCTYFRRQEHFVTSRTFRTQSMETTRAFISKTKILALLFVALSVILLFSTVLAMGWDITFRSGLYLRNVNTSQRAMHAFVDRFESEREESEEDFLSQEELLEMPQSSNPWGSIFMFVVIVLGLIVIVGALSVLAINRDKRKEDDARDYDEEVEVFDVEINRGKKQKVKRLVGNMIIRLMYKRKIKSYKRKGLVLLKPGDTANKLSGDVSRIEDISSLNEMYHEARYSDRKINVKDISSINKNK